MKPFWHLISGVALACFCMLHVDGAEESPRAPKREMKGMELYSWRDAATHQWIYSLVRGTNALKTTAQIMDPRNAIKTVAELKVRLGALAVGEYVAWNSHADPQVFSLPPQEVVQQITAFSDAQQISLSVTGE